MDYKTEQKKYRGLAKAKKILHLSPKFSAPLDLGIRKFKRTGATQEFISIYKDNAWKSSRELATKEKP